MSLLCKKEVMTSVVTRDILTHVFNRQQPHSMRICYVSQALHPISREEQHKHRPVGEGIDIDDYSLK
eukprot:6468300-Amphidinium_carterae.3